MSRKPFRHLNLDERKMIEKRLNDGVRCNQISFELKRGFGAIYREVRLNGGKEGYNAIEAHNACMKARKSGIKNTKLTSEALLKIKSLFDDQIPVKEIVKKLNALNICPSVTLQTIYLTLHSKGWKRINKREKPET